MYVYGTIDPLTLHFTNVVYEVSSVKNQLKKALEKTKVTFLALRKMTRESKSCVESYSSHFIICKLIWWYFSSKDDTILCELGFVVVLQNLFVNYTMLCRGHLIFWVISLQIFAEKFKQNLYRYHVKIVLFWIPALVFKTHFKLNL